MPQTAGQAVVSTDFGMEARIASLSGSERLNEPFSYDIEVLTDEAVDFASHLGTGIGVALIEASGANRTIRGILWEAETLGFESQFGFRARLNIRPWTALLDLGLNTRIFQKMTTPDIVKAVFADAGFTAFELVAKGTYKPREYCVQWRESDLHFVQRLMEEEGLYTFISHSEASHKLQICDSPTNHTTPPGREKVSVNTEAGEGMTTQRLWSWTATAKPALAKVSLRDQHFKKPQDALVAANKVDKTNPQDVAEFYDYPGYFGYLSDGGDQAGDLRVNARLEGARAQMLIYRGIGDVIALAAGDKISIDGKGKGAFSGDVMVVSVVHSLKNTGMGQEDEKEGDKTSRWTVEIEAVPADTRWHVDKRKIKPTAGGPQTAVVVGPDGQIVHVDEHGRVLVRFFWDRRTKTEKGEAITCDTRSCWVRVSQAWADAGFGHMVLPRIGEEVVVDFLDGDPDRPIITGRVHNSEHMLPYTLPDNKTKSTWKSQTVGDDNGDWSDTEDKPSGKGFNEFGYEDKGGVEEVFFHAQRDYKGRTRHDHNHKIGRDEVRRVGHDSTLTIKNNKTTTLDEGDEARTLTKGSRKTTIFKDETVEIQSGDHKTTVDEGNLTVDVTMGKIAIEAFQEIQLKVGQNTIKISQSGIEMHGLTVDVKADTALTTNGQLTAEHKAGIQMSVSGAMVMIN